MKKPFIQEAHLSFIAWTGNPVEIKQIHKFIKNNQAMTKQDFKSTFSEIRDFLTSQSVNFGLMMTGDGTYVFTEKKVKMNAMMVKLTTGINYEGVVKDAKADLDILNRHLQTERTK